MLLTELKAKIDTVFENELKVPEPAIHWKDKLEALRESKLTSHESSLIYDMRNEQARMMGFEELNVVTAVEMLMGEKHTNLSVDEDWKKEDRQSHEWVYNHHNGDVYTQKDSWGGMPTDWYRMERKGLWYLPPFALKESWRCRLGKLNYLKRDIPYGVVLRMQEIKTLNLFNCFSVLAPVEAWTHKASIDPIVFASIWELPTKQSAEDKQKYGSAGQVTHYFLAQW